MAKSILSNKSIAFVNVFGNPDVWNFLALKSHRLTEFFLETNNTPEPVVFTAQLQSINFQLAGKLQLFVLGAYVVLGQ